MKILIFGIGRYYQNRKSLIRKDADIIAYIDNNKHLLGTYIDGVPIVSPYDIGKFVYDKILLMSIRANEMKRQLLELGIENEKIWYWEQYCKETASGHFKFYCGNERIIEAGKKVLIISTDLNYNGGSLAAFYAVLELQKRGYNVILAAPNGSEKFINEIVEKGINVMICHVFPYICVEESFWIRQFDIVLVNTFQMIACAYEISKVKPVVWWIHEPSMLYEDIIFQFNECIDISAMTGLNVYAVSNIPKNNFNRYFSNKIKKILEYGIPDEISNVADWNKNGKIVFAIIGVVCPRKAQDIFIKAIKLLDKRDTSNAVFKIIGAIGEDSYGNEVNNLALKNPSIEILGELTRYEMSSIYKNIDIVVCPSREDPLPIVMTEGMMYGKVCITSDANGTVGYIEDGKNGFICKSSDQADLAKKMHWIINNKDKLHEIGIQARKTYEKYFTLEKFGDRLESALSETMNKYKGNKAI